MRKTGKRKGKIKYFSIIVFLLLALAVIPIYQVITADKALKIDELYDMEVPNYVDVKYIPNDTNHSRTGEELSEVKNIVIHYVGNPATTAKQNHNYFSTEGVKVNSHFLIGLDGECIQCIPLYERSSASNWRNIDTISIEVCHPDSSGKFNEKTTDMLIKLTAWLLDTCRLDESAVIRHYDITGKLCPKYFVENEDEWNAFKTSIKTELKNLKKAK